MTGIQEEVKIRGTHVAWIFCIEAFIDRYVEGNWPEHVGDDAFKAAIRMVIHLNLKVRPELYGPMAFDFKPIDLQDAYDCGDVIDTEPES